MHAGRRALIVDDNEVNLMLAEAALAMLGWTTRSVPSGTAALAAAASACYDLVLLDISMPDIGGVEVCGRLRRMESMAAARIVAYTAHAMADEHEVLIAAGFDGILLKPAALDDIRAMLARLHLENRGPG